MAPRMPVGLTALALLVLTLGCTQSSGPVQQVTIDPGQVKSLVLHGHYVMKDADLIRRCVDELNRLAYQPFRPPMSLRVGEELVLKDEDGNKIAGFGFTDGICIRVFLPESDAFYIVWRSMPVTGKVFSYGQYKYAREQLTSLAKKEVWDKEDVRMVDYHIRGIQSSRPDMYVAIPSSPGELRALDETLLSPNPQMLDEFADNFRPY